MLRKYGKQNGSTTIKGADGRIVGNISGKNLSGPKRAVSIGLAATAAIGGITVFGAGNASATENPISNPNTRAFVQQMEQDSTIAVRAAGNKSSSKCVITITADRGTKADMEVAAAYWNTVTGPLGYTLDVASGNVDYDNGRLSNSNNSRLSAMEVDTKGLHVAIKDAGIPAKAGHAYGGLGGGSLRGVMINEQANFGSGNMRQNVAIHEVGHAIGITEHDKAPGQLMSATVNSGNLKLSDSAIAQVEENAYAMNMLCASEGGGEG